MGIFRILRCNPFVEGGVDVVPEKFTILEMMISRRIFVSKREKNIEILEVEKIVDNNTITELTTKDQEVIGRILQDEKRYIAELKNGETFRVSSQAEAMEILLREYHLHR